MNDTNLSDEAAKEYVAMTITMKYVQTDAVHQAYVNGLRIGWRECRRRAEANRWVAFTNKELEIFDYYLDIEVEHSPSETRLSMVKELQAELSRRKEAP